MADLIPVPKMQFFDDDGNPLSNGFIYTYEAGGVTPKATYTTAAGDVEHQNPVQLDPAGRAAIYINAESYKFVVKDADLNIISTTDNLTLPSVAALASAFYRDVVYIAFADSPYSISSTHNGKLIVADTSGGAIAVTLPEISGVDLPFNIAFLLRTAGNNLTITRAGSDTIMGSTSKIVSAAGVGAQFAGDDGKSPDDWSVIDFGTVADLGVTYAKLSTNIITGATEDLTPDSEADYVLSYDNSATALKKVKVGRSRDLKVQSKSATYTALVTDDLIICSGASWTLNLPTAVGYSGKVLQILHNGTSLTQVYTLDGNSSETIAGTTTYALYTNGEKLRIVSDGANWQVLDHRAVLGPTAFTPVFNNFGSVVTFDFKFERMANIFKGWGSFTAPSPAASRAYLTMPSGLDAIDTTSLGSTVKPMGLWTTTNSNNSSGAMLYVNSVSELDFGTNFASTGGPGGATSNANGMGGVGNAIILSFEVPMSTWRT